METNSTQVTLRQRVEKFLQVEKLTAAEFSREIGVSPAFVTSIKKNIGLDKLEKMRKINPRINLNWLLFGEGSMYTDDSELKELRQEVAALREKVTLQQTIIELYQRNENAEKTAATAIK